MNKRDPLSPAARPVPSQDEISHRAREIWVQRGRPAGQDLEIWFEAERQLQNPPAAKHDEVAVEPTARGVVKARRGDRPLSAKVADALRGKGGVAQGGHSRIDPTT